MTKLVLDKSINRKVNPNKKFQRWASDAFRALNAYLRMDNKNHIEEHIRVLMHSIFNTLQFCSQGCYKEFLKKEHTVKKELEIIDRWFKKNKNDLPQKFCDKHGNPGLATTRWFIENLFHDLAYYLKTGSVNEYFDQKEAEKIKEKQQVEILDEWIENNCSDLAKDIAIHIKELMGGNAEDLLRAIMILIREWESNKGG